MRFTAATRLLALSIALLGALGAPALSLAHGVGHEHEARDSRVTAGVTGSTVSDASDTHEHPSIGAQVTRRAFDAPAAPAMPVIGIAFEITIARDILDVSQDRSLGYASRDGTPPLSTGPPATA